jgi:hypothetical protein
MQVESTQGHQPPRWPASVLRTGQWGELNCRWDRFRFARQHRAEGQPERCGDGDCQGHDQGDRAVPDVVLIESDEQEVRQRQQRSNCPQCGEPSEDEVVAAISGQPQPRLDSAGRTAGKQGRRTQRPTQPEAYKPDRLA